MNKEEKLSIEEILERDVENTDLEIPLLCIPSKGRYKKENSLTIQHISKYPKELRCKVFVYAEEIEEYNELVKEYTNIEIVEVILPPPEILKNTYKLKAKINFIIEYMKQLDEKFYFIIDDDVKNCKKTYTKYTNGNVYTRCKDTTILHALKLHFYTRTHISKNNPLFSSALHPGFIFVSLLSNSLVYPFRHLYGIRLCDNIQMKEIDFKMDDDKSLWDVDIGFTCILKYKKIFESYNTSAFNFFDFNDSGASLEGGLHEDFSNGLREKESIALKEKYDEYIKVNKEKNTTRQNYRRAVKDAGIMYIKKQLLKENTDEG